MADILSKKQRSRCMSAIRGKNTKPEITMRRMAHRLGYRFRLYRDDLPGTPDLTFPRLRAVVFVNGCFWHSHRCRYGKVMPKANAAFWRKKRLKTVLRDRRNRSATRKLGWRVLTVWECQLRDIDAVQKRLIAFLGDGPASHSPRP